MKGNWAGFSGGGGNSGGGCHDGDSGLVNGKDYNSAGSSSVGKVESVSTLSNSHSVPIISTPNSVTKNYRDGKLNNERYYGEDGTAYLDIDYSNHGNSLTHPHVPHEHIISFDENGKMHRGKEKGIK